MEQTLSGVCSSNCFCFSLFLFCISFCFFFCRTTPTATARWARKPSAAKTRMEQVSRDCFHLFASQKTLWGIGNRSMHECVCYHLHPGCCLFLTGSSKHSKSASPPDSPRSNDKDNSKRSKSTSKDKSDLAKTEKTSGGKKVLSVALDWKRDWFPSRHALLFLKSTCTWGIVAQWEERARRADGHFCL